MGCTQGTVIFEYPSGDYDFTGHKEHYRDDGAYVQELKHGQELPFTCSGEYKVCCTLSPLIAQCQEITISFVALDIGWSGQMDIVLTRKGEILFGQEIYVASKYNENEVWSEVVYKLSLEHEIIHSAEVGDVYQIRRFVGSESNMKLTIKNLKIVVTGLHGAAPVHLQFEEWLVDETFFMATHQTWKWYPKTIDYWIAWTSTPPLIEAVKKIYISFQIKLINVTQSTPYERRDFQGKIKLRLMRHNECIASHDIVCCRYETQQVTSKPVRMMFDATSTLVSRARIGDYYDIARSVSGRKESGGVSVLGILVRQFSLRLSGNGVCCAPLRQKISHYVEDESSREYLQEERTAERSSSLDHGHHVHHSANGGESHESDSSMV